MRKVVKSSVNVAADLWKRAKMYAVRKELTLTEVFEAALRRYLEIEESKKEGD